MYVLCIVQKTKSVIQVIFMDKLLGMFWIHDFFVVSVDINMHGPFVPKYNGIIHFLFLLFKSFMSPFYCQSCFLIMCELKSQNKKKKIQKESMKRRKLFISFLPNKQISRSVKMSDNFYNPE